MSCYIKTLKLLPRGSYILSGAPFTTSSGRLRLKGPSSQLVSWKIALRPLQGRRHYWTKPDDGSKEEPAGDKRHHYGSSLIQGRHRHYSEGGGDKEEARGKEGGQNESSLVWEGHRHYSEGGGTNGGQKGFWERVKRYMSRFFSSGQAVKLCTALGLPFSFVVYVSWNMRPSKIDQMRNQPIQNLLIGDIKTKVQCRKQTEINRDQIIASIQKNLIKPESVDDEKKFGLILGPTGTGKSFATQLACKQNPFGVLYTEVDTGHKFVEIFARDTGVPIEPNGLFDFVAKHFSNNYIHHYKLNGIDKFEDILDIITILSEQAEQFTIKYNQMPCLFIDGTDLLAEEYPSQFPSLVSKAKKYANEGILRIVFVSSEGHIMPLLQSTSSYSRSTVVLEILDLDDEKGKEYLVKNKLPPGLAEKVVKYAGGRMIFLLDALNVYHYYQVEVKKESDSITLKNEEELERRIKRYLYSKYAEKAYIEMLSVDRPSVKLLLKEMSNSHDQCINLREALSKIKEEKEIIRIRMVVKKLVEANVFRYDKEGYLRFHNRIIEDDIKGAPPL